MRKGVALYPFKGKMMSLPEISRYYNKKRIELNYNMFASEIKKIAEKVGRENITEEQIIDVVKSVLSKKNLGTALSDYKENCIKEFGQEFWDNLLARKASIGEARKFRLSMKVNINKNNIEPIEKKIETEREAKDGGVR